MNTFKIENCTNFRSIEKNNCSQKKTLTNMENFRNWAKKQTSYFGEPGPCKTDLKMYIADCAMTRQQFQNIMYYHLIILAVLCIIFIVLLYLLISTCRENRNLRKKQRARLNIE